MKIVIIGNFAPHIVNFRKSLILELRKYAEVFVLAPFENEKTSSEIRSLGVEYREFFLNPRGMNPLHDLLTGRNLVKILKDISPDIVFSYTIKPIIWGSIAARQSNIKNIYAMVTGVGYAFMDANTIKSKIAKKVATFLYRKALKYNEGIFFQNEDDFKLFKEKRVVSNKSNSIVINGSGVDLDYYKLSSPYIFPIRFLMIARLLKDKGLMEYLTAAKLIRAKHPDVEFHLVGYRDQNPSCISESELNDLMKDEDIIFHGKVSDVRPLIENSSVFVLPSYREGTSRSVLEAMSMGKPIITSDAPGCKETVIDGYNGFLVPIKNVNALVNSMLEFVFSTENIVKMGLNSRKLAEEKYDVKKVNQKILTTMNLVEV